jgi:hypothetical protein
MRSKGGIPVPRAAATLGWEFVRADVEHGTIDVAVRARRRRALANLPVALAF